MGQHNSYKGNQLIGQPPFVRTLDVSVNDFYAYDRSDVQTNFASTLDPNGANRFYGGFLFKTIDTDGDVNVITLDDFKALKQKGNLASIDTYKQTISNNTAGIWNETPVIKIFNDSAVTDLEIGV